MSWCHTELPKTVLALCSKNNNHPKFGNASNRHNKELHKNDCEIKFWVRGHEEGSGNR